MIRAISRSTGGRLIGNNGRNKILCFFPLVLKAKNEYNRTVGIDTIAESR